MAEFPRRHLFPWHRPLLPQAVAWLAADWNGDGPLDLSALFVVVATRQAGRRLREGLAAHAAARGQAVFPPRIGTPDSLLASGAQGTDTATPLATQLAWVAVLRRAALEEFRAVFPIDPPARDFDWARRLAGQLANLQDTLAEGGLRIAGVADRAGADFPEADRWRQLGELERRCDAALAGERLRSAPRARIAAAADPAWPAGIAKIVALAVPDPEPLAVGALARHLARGRVVELAVFGPDLASFDAWGRPLPEVWDRRILDWPNFRERVHLCSGPADQAAHAVALAQAYPAPEGALALGIGDREVLAPLEAGLARVGQAVFNPAGEARRRDALHALLAALAQFAREDTFVHAAALLRCPDVLEWLRARSATFSPATTLAQLDALQAKHLPPTAEANPDWTGKFPAAVAALEALRELRATLTAGEFPANAAAALHQLFAGRRIESDSPLTGSAGAWLDILREAGAALAHFPEATPTEAWDLALAQFGASVRYDDKPDGALELNGWLELAWEDAPHLVVTGLNDGRVPEAVVGDAFLPEALRGPLGLKTNATRFARDACLLAALAACRAGGGRLDLLVGRVSAAGDPLRPSRLLFLCAGAELPERVAYLFRESAPVAGGLPWTRAWQLRPRAAPPPTRISVTALRHWLACPFRFYLRHVLRMEPVDPARAELDAFDFGTLVHAALQAAGGDPALRDCLDEAMLRDAMLAAFDRCARQRYGELLTLPLVVQFESARQRLRAAAAVEARERADGWRTERVEWAFERSIGGVTIAGKIDRIDRHIDGRIRVLDYKTSDRAVEPAQAHLGPVRADTAKPEWARLTVDGKERAWIDLQLPLYRLAVAEEFGAAVECGYFNLPKAVGDAAVCAWPELAGELQAKAEECARQTAMAIAAGQFWPPAEPTGRDDEWAGLFHEGTAASVRWPEAREGAP